MAPLSLTSVQQPGTILGTKAVQLLDGAHRRPRASRSSSASTYPESSAKAPDRTGFDKGRSDTAGGGETIGAFC